MLLAGDEFGHTQRGNNNAYCQDNEISWIDWNGRTARDLAFADVREDACCALRREHPAFQRDAFFTGRRSRAATAKTSPGTRPPASR